MGPGGRHGAVPSAGGLSNSIIDGTDISKIMNDGWARLFTRMVVACLNTAIFPAKSVGIVKKGRHSGAFDRFFGGGGICGELDERYGDLS